MKNELMMNNSLRKEYISRINRVVDYIEKNISVEFTSDELAEIACFSKFHFQRIFASITGETLNKFITRLRLEKAANSLLMYEDKPIIEILMDAGFLNPSSFARSFKDYFGVSASEYRLLKKTNKLSLINSTGCKVESNCCKEFTVTQEYFSNVSFNQQWSIKMKDAENTFTQVKVIELKEMHTVYVRHTGPYAGNENLFEKLFSKLFSWAGPRGLINPPESKTLTVYHDNLDITDEEKLRISVCITVPENTEVDGEIGKMVIPGGKYACAKFEINPDEYHSAWQSIYSGWLPESGYEPDDGPCFELYLNDPKTHPEGKHVFEIYVSVRPVK